MILIVVQKLDCCNNYFWFISYLNTYWKNFIFRTENLKYFNITVLIENFLLVVIFYWQPGRYCNSLAVYWNTSVTPSQSFVVACCHYCKSKKPAKWQLETAIVVETSTSDLVEVVVIVEIAIVDDSNLIAVSIWD